MKMEIDLETMLDIALGGPEIGPLNLQVLHGVMREMFQRMELSNQNIVVEKESSEFCNSFNFIKSKMEEKDKRPRTAGGTLPKFKSNVSVIVSDYVRVPIGGSTPNMLLPSNEIEDRLRYLESELKNWKDFPSVDELRSWATEKANPDTVVTDLWHFVSLNHRVNGLEEGIQKLTKLVDRFIPELKSLGEEQTLLHGQVDDLYSQFKGLSDRLTYVDSKLDSSVEDMTNIIENKIQIAHELIRNLEKKLDGHPKFKDLNRHVTNDVFNETQEKARLTIKDLRDQLSTKINYSILEEMVSKEDFKSFADVVNSVNTKLDDYAKLSDLENYVTHDTYDEVEKSTKNFGKEIDNINVALAGKADISKVDECAIKADLDKLSARIDGFKKLDEQQTDLYNKMYLVEERLKKKADNDDVMDVLKKEDMKKTFSKIQNHQCAINELQGWQKSFETDEKPILNSKVNDLMNLTSEMKDSLSVLQDEHSKPKDVDVVALQNNVQRLDDCFHEHDKTCKSHISGILHNIDLKLDKSEIEPLKEYLEGCYNALAQQYQDSLGDQCNHPIHQPKKSQGMPYLSPSSINISKKTADELGSHDAFIHPKNDAAVMRSQMKYNCLSCSQPIANSHNHQLQTIRGKPLNAYELDHLRLLQKMLKNEVVESENRACGGKHTSSMPYKKTSRGGSAKSGPARAFTSQEGVLIDGEVDIEGLDGKLYRGLISRKDFICPNRCKSANAELRTVSPMPGSGKDRPISAKSTDFRVNYARVMAS